MNVTLGLTGLEAITQAKESVADLARDIATAHAEIEQLHRIVAFLTSPSDDIRAMGQAEACAYEPTDGDVMISIRSHGAPIPELSPKWSAVLSIEADDVGFESWEGEGRRALSERDAIRIAAFATRHRLWGNRIFVHCFAGASRSVSVAMALRSAFGLRNGCERITNPLAYNRVADAVEALVKDAKAFPKYSSAPETPTAPVEAGAANSNPTNDL